MSLGTVRAAIEKAEKGIDAEGWGEAHAGYGQQMATLALAQAVAELALKVDQLALETKRATHLR